MSTHETKTSAQWRKEYPKIRILDYDGWDRSNLDFSFNRERITRTEFEKRLYASTCQRLN